MKKFLLDCSGTQEINEKIRNLAKQVQEIETAISNYPTDAEDFDFESPKKIISANINAAYVKLENTNKIINTVIERHTELQNRLIFDPNVTNSNTTSIEPQSISDPINQSSIPAYTIANVATSTAVGTAVATEISSSDNNTQYEGEVLTLQKETTTIPADTNPNAEVNQENDTTNTSTFNNLTVKKTIEVPKGLGKYKTFMGWQLITSKSSPQYAFREKVGMNFDEEGFAKVGDRYVIACTNTFGNVGDLIDFKQADGTIIKCVVGDLKSQSYSSYDHNPANKWGHDEGKVIVEFIVDKNSSWYRGGHSNPGTRNCHPEWNDYIVSATNYGSYYDIVGN